MLKIHSIASALPEQRISNSMIAEWCGLEEAFVATKIGVTERRFLAENETGLDLCVRAVERLRQKNAAFDPARLQLIICVTQNPDFTLPHMSALIQQRIGAPSTAACFDIALGCSGYVYALSVAKGLAVVNSFSEALIVTCDPYSRIMDRRNRDVMGLFGDAASATWLSSDGTGDIGKFDFGTDGAGAVNLLLRCTAANKDQCGDPNDASLQMNGRAIFNFMMQRVPKSVGICLAANGLSEGEVDYFVFHQASRFLLETLTKQMNLDDKKVKIQMEYTGNTVSSTIPMVLEQMLDSGACFNKTALLSGFGVGLSWATTVVRFGDGNG